MVGQSDVVSDVVIHIFNGSGKGTPSTREIKSRGRTYYDATIFGARHEENTYFDSARSVDAGYTTAMISNADYYFTVENATSRPYHITDFNRFASVAERDEHWESALNLTYGRVAEDLDTWPLAKLIKGDGGKLKSASEIQSNGSILVLLTFDRVFPSSQKPYFASATVDPAFHWAVRSYVQNFSNRVEKGEITYQADMPDVAFPESLTESEFDLNNVLSRTRTFTFKKPQKSNATARQFILEDFGLETPKSQIHNDAVPPFLSDQTRPAASLTPAVISSQEVSAGKPFSSFSSSLVALVAAFAGIVCYVLFLVSRRRHRAK
jgi:hypothetical protein